MAAWQSVVSWREKHVAVSDLLRSHWLWRADVRFISLYSGASTKRSWNVTPLIVPHTPGHNCWWVITLVITTSLLIWGGMCVPERDTYIKSNTYIKNSPLNGIFLRERNILPQWMFGRNGIPNSCIWCIPRIRRDTLQLCRVKWALSLVLVKFID